MKQLYIIGNGFDIAHGIPSGYDKFHEWLVNHGERNFIDYMERFFPDTIVKYNAVGIPVHESTLWSKFEYALGLFDAEGIFQYFSEDIKIDYDHHMQSAAAIEDAPQQFFEKLLSEMQENFENWVADIDLTKVSPKQINHFSTNGLFLSFNYTSTLEQIYGISRNQIEYIHGNASRDDHLVVGHCNKVPEIHDNDMPLYEETGRNNVIQLGNGLKKNTRDVISNHQPFFRRLDSSYDTIICYGHSYACVDDPYFEEIIKRINPNAQWHLSWYNNDDMVKMQNFECRMNMIPANCHPFQM